MVHRFDLYITCPLFPDRGPVAVRSAPKTVRCALSTQQKCKKSFLTMVNHLEPFLVAASGINRSVIFWLSGVAVESGSGR